MNTPAAAPAVLLEMRGISRRFGAVKALSGVDLCVRRGEVHALIGENGAGKSTLMKVLSGAIRADSGSMELDGKAYDPRGPSDASGRGVCMIYQELTLAAPLTVTENLFLGRELHRFGLRDQRTMRDRCAEALAVLGQPELTPEKRVADLSPAARQLVEIARALVFDARLVVMDEPTSSLSQHEVERLFVIIGRLRERGVAVIYISHFLEEVRRVAQRFSVLRDGAFVATGDVRAGSREEAHAFDESALRLMAGRPPSQAYPRVEHAPGALRLELRELAGKRQPREVALTLKRGEILGIFGLMGAGRSELLRVLFGLDAAAGGELRCDERSPFQKLRGTPAQRWREGLGMVSENRKEEGLALSMSIAANLTLSAPPARFGFVSSRAQEARTRALGERLALRFHASQDSVSALSGGNQQKVALLRLLHHEVDVYLLDEPTRGIDVSSKAAIYRLLGELAAQGKAILIVSSYLPELIGICDRIAVMCRGVLSPARPTSGWTTEGLLAAATAGERASEAAP